MHKLFRKSTALLLALLLMLSVFPAAVLTVSAADDNNSTGASHLTVNASSNYFPKQVSEFDPSTETVTTTWFICITDAAILNLQWTVTYDTDVLAVSDLNKNNKGAWQFMPAFPYGGINNPNVVGYPNQVKGNNSATDLLDACTEDGGAVPFVSITWDVKNAKDTTVYLELEELTLSRLDPNTGLSDYSAEQEVVYHSQIRETTYAIDEIYSSVYEGGLDWNYTNPAENPTAAPATTAKPTQVPTPSDYLRITATSNIFPQMIKTFDESIQGDKVTVTYFINVPDYNLLDATCILTYDPEVLKVNAADNRDGKKWNFMPPSNGEGQYNHDTEYEGQKAVMATVASVETYELTNNGEKVAFFTVTFEVIKGGDTAVNLFVRILDFAKYDESTYMMEEGSDKSVIDRGVIYDTSDIEYTETAVYEGAYNPDATAPEETTTVAPTTAPKPTEPLTTAPKATDAPEPTDTTEPASYTYVVAGSAYLLDAGWDGSTESGNIMTEQGGVYVLTIPNVAATEDIMQLKVVEWNTSDPDAAPRWIGDENGNNITFSLVADGDVTIIYDPATDKIRVEGPGVKFITELDIDAIRLAGNGDGTWLNGVNWDPADDANKMEKLADGIYTITYEEIETFDNYEFKFAANGTWVDNWGGAIDPDLTVTGDNYVIFNGAAAYDGDNITLEVGSEEDEDALYNVKIQLDLREFDYSSKSGGSFTITITPLNGEEPTTPVVTSAPVQPTSTFEAPTEFTTVPVYTTVPLTTTVPVTELPTAEVPTDIVPATEETEPTEAPTNPASPEQPATEYTEPEEPTDASETEPATTEAVEPTAPKRLKGDVDNNGEVNSRDRIVLTRYLAKWAGYNSIHELNSDVNEDTTVDAKDRIILTRHLARWAGYEDLETFHP